MELLCRWVWVNPMVVLVLLTMTATVQAGPYRVTIGGQDTALGETPILVALKTPVPPGEYRLRPEGQGPSLRASVFVDGEKTYFATVVKQLPPRTTLSYTMEPEVKSEAVPRGVAFRAIKGDLEVLVNGKPITVYHTDEPSKPYFYPIFGPNGSEFTRAYPIKKDVAGEDRDHPHHRSLWFTFGDVNKVDFWASDPHNKPGKEFVGFGTTRETSRTVVASGPVGVLRTTDDWNGPDGKPVLHDVRVVRFYETAGARVIDFDITLKAPASSSAKFHDTKEGMFGLRVASSMDVVHGKDKAAGKITNAEGVNDDNAWGKASPWVDYVGPVDGKTVGIAILNHPDSFRYPTTWHVRTYGLFAANPFGWKSFGQTKSGDYTLPAGESIRFEYRLIFHEGDTEKARIADAFKAYAEPPTVTIQAE